METLCELLHGDNLKNGVYLEERLCLICTNVILQSSEFLSVQKLEVVQILNEELKQSSYQLEEILREETGVFFQLVDSLGSCLLKAEVELTYDNDLPETQILFESVCVCLYNIVCEIYHTLGRNQAENCLDLLLKNVEIDENYENSSLSDCSYKIIFFLLFFMKREEQKDADIYEMIALKVLRNNKATSFILSLICHNNIPNIRLVAASLIFLCLQLVCIQESSSMRSTGHNVNSRSFGSFLASQLPSDFENILELDPDITDPTLQELLVQIVSCLLRCGYPNFQTMIDKVILFLQLRCLFPDIRVRVLVVDTLRSLLERNDCAGIIQYVYITGMPEYLLESIKTAFQMKLETDADLECIANCFEGIFSVIQKLLQLEETRETRSSFVFLSLVQSVVSFLKFIKANKQFDNFGVTNQLLLSFFRLSHTFFEETALPWETDSTNSVSAQGYISLKFFIPFFDFLSRNELLEEEMAFLLVELTKDKPSSLEEQLELLALMHAKFKSRGCILNVAYTILSNIIRTAEEERPNDYIEICHRIITPQLSEFNVESLQNKEQVDILLNFLRLVNDFLVPTFWERQANDKLVALSKSIWKNFHPNRLFSFFEICASIENKTQLYKTFRAFLARLVTVIEPDVELNDAITYLPMNELELCKGLQQISHASYVSLKLLLLDHSIRREWVVELRKLYYCIESISTKLPEKESVEHIKLAELVTQVWALLCRDKTFAELETKPGVRIRPKQLYIPKAFISFFFKHLPKEMSRNIECIKMLVESSQGDVESCRILHTRILSLQNEQLQDTQASVEEATSYFRLVIELTSSFDCYGELFLQDISRLTQWLRFPLENIDLYAFKETIQFWCNGILHFTNENNTKRIALRLIRLGLLPKLNDFLHATVDYHKKGGNEKEQLHLSSRTNKLVVYLFDAFNKWILHLEAGSVEYLDNVNDILQSLLTAVDSFATLSHPTLSEFLNCLHILVNFFDRIANSENLRIASSTSKSLVRNILSKKTWFHNAIREYFELFLTHQCQQEHPAYETCRSYQPQWESLLSLLITLIAYGSKKNLQLLEILPKSLFTWRNAILACCKFQECQRPLLIVETNLLFACVARAREYQWEPEQTQDDLVIYSLCNQIFSSHTLVEISAYRAMEAWILSLRSVGQPIKRQTTLEAVKSCLRIKLVQNLDTPLLVTAPRMSLFACFLQHVEQCWTSKSQWEGILQLVSQLLTNNNKATNSNRIQWECMEHIFNSLQYAPRDCLEKYPDIMQAVSHLACRPTSTTICGPGSLVVHCPILFDDIVLTPAVYQWQQEECNNIYTKDWFDYEKHTHNENANKR